MGFDTRVRGRLASSVRKEVKDVQSLHNMLLRNHPGLLPLLVKGNLWHNGREEDAHD